MKTSNDRSIGEVLKELIEVYRLEGKLNEIKVVHSWEKVVGSLIARFTRDIYIKRGKLFVKVDSPALKNELTYNASVIIERLNTEAGTKVVDEIIFI
jgi:predicted nucleic acid-binding Zn ribbon protein